VHILIVEADSAQASATMKALLPLGHELIKMENGEKALRHFQRRAVDLMVLDWNLPEMSGFEVLHWTRTHIGSEMPILFLAGKVLEVDIVSALDAGADDCVIKPFRMAEFAARVNVLLRRREQRAHPHGTICAGEYILNLAHRSVLLHGEKIKLTSKEFDILTVLFNNLGRFVSREMMTVTAWGRELDSSRTLDTHIYRLRRKLFLSPEHGLRLSAIYARGYRLDELKSSPV
jgi:DNA-binding response OmpR family regulator